MRKVLLICAAGMSTSLLMNKMREYAASIDYDVTVDAQPVGTVATLATDAYCSYPREAEIRITDSV